MYPEPKKNPSVNVFDYPQSISKTHDNRFAIEEISQFPCVLKNESVSSLLRNIVPWSTQNGWSFLSVEIPFSPRHKFCLITEDEQQLESHGLL